jgi:membrane-bound acyltransferase YfiQ involved in biofilm formation
MTKGIAGYFAFCILVHHYTNVIRLLPSYNGELQILEYMGVLLVGFFFLFSGYGLIISYKEKENYLDTFMIRRVCAVLIPFFICNYAYMITALLTGCKFQMNELILAFFGTSMTFTYTMPCATLSVPIGNCPFSLIPY